MKRRKKSFNEVEKNSKEQLIRINIHKPYGIYERIFKRPLDVLCALAGVLLFWWLYIVIALLVKINLGSPVFFSQERPGKDEKIFRLYKFRTMTNAKDPEGNFLSDEKRLTKFGKWLRSSSLDELPEFFNIIKGDMSFIGPRPLLVRYLPRYSQEQHRRHEVNPGLTGLAQVHGRNKISWEDKLRLDVEYVDHITFKNDMKILLETFIVVLRHNDISIEVEEFMGTEKVIHREAE